MRNIIRFQKPTGDLLLATCPFCGSHEVVYAEYECEAGKRWQVICTECTASIDPGWAQQRHIVQQMWNKRNRTEAKS